MRLRFSETFCVEVPFPDGPFPISAVTLEATVAALDDACLYRGLNPKQFALGVLQRGKK